MGVEQCHDSWHTTPAPSPMSSAGWECDLSPLAATAGQFDGAGDIDPVHRRAIAFDDPYLSPFVRRAATSASPRACFVTRSGMCSLSSAI